MSNSRRGFASMDPAKVRAIAKLGGQAAHRKGKAHEYTSDTGREAGRKGGVKISLDHVYMAEIGRKGGQASAAKRQGRQEQQGI